jgi:hypothetical protein
MGDSSPGPTLIPVPPAQIQLHLALVGWIEAGCCGQAGNLAHDCCWHRRGDSHLRRILEEYAPVLTLPAPGSGSVSGLAGEFDGHTDG